MGDLNVKHDECHARDNSVTPLGQPVTDRDTCDSCDSLSGTVTVVTDRDKEAYNRLSNMIDIWYPTQIRWFQPKDVYQEFNVLTTKGKDNCRKILERLVDHKKLERTKLGYRPVDTTLDHVAWLDATGGDTPFSWPKGRDGTGFSFDGDIEVYPKDIIVVSGVSNTGKSGFAINTVIENMDNYHVRLMGNELDARKFAHRMRYFDWVPLVNDNGQPKFEAIRRYENHQDIILPDALNIIDWLNLGDNFWQVGKIIEGIQSKLTTGVCVIVLQKSEGKALGRGGDFSRDLASVYFAIDKDLLTVVKAKSYKRKNPNGKQYHFSLDCGGSSFNDIYEVKLCRHCGGKKVKYVKGGAEDCDGCQGTGYQRVEPKPTFDEI